MRGDQEAEDEANDISDLQKVTGVVALSFWSVSYLADRVLGNIVLSSVLAAIWLIAAITWLIEYSLRLRRIYKGIPEAGKNRRDGH